MIANVIYDKVRPLEPDLEELANRLFAPLHARAIGRRGKRTLVLKVTDPARAPHNFRDALIVIIRSPEAAPLHEHFDEASYN